VAFGTSRLSPPKTLEMFDFTIQPSLNKERNHALTGLDFIRHGELVLFLGLQ